ncbi:MAG TPA: SpoIIE family protein phosphatase [Bacteroidia bacterium]|nr:SpoIIE family protein phosphatase [Bacteroidia bacterium]
MSLKNSFYQLSIASFCLLFIISLESKGINGGVTFIKNFTEKSYNAHAENHYIAQDKKGIMYFANAECILTFDGTKWNGIYLPNVPHVYAVAVNNEGVVFAGGENEFGYLSYDKQGAQTYVSLTNLIPKDKRIFTDIFDIVCTDSLIYFLAEERLFIYNHKQIFTIDPLTESKFRVLFKVNNQVYINDKNQGLQQVIGKKFLSVKNTSDLGELRVKSMFEIDKHLLVCTGQNKFVDITSQQNNQQNWFNIPLENNLIVRTAIKLSNGNICVGSKNEGLLIFNTKGKILAKYNIQNGLINNSVWYLYEDVQKNIWVATDKGISYLEMSSKILKIPSNLLTEVNLNSVVNDDNKIYIGTSQGLTKLVKTDETINEEKLSTDLEAYHIVTVFKDNLQTKHTLVATDHGISELINNKLVYIDEEGDFPIKIIAPSKFNRNIFFAAGPGKIVIYRYDKNKWIKISSFDIGGDNIISFTEPNKSTIWAGTISNKYFELKLSTLENKTYTIKSLNLSLKRLNKYSTLFFNCNGNICIDADDGIAKFNNNNWSTINHISGFPNDTNFLIMNVFETNNERIWINAINDAGNFERGLLKFDSHKKNLVWEGKFLKRFYNIQINSICEVNNDLWLASNEGLFYYNLNETNTGSFTYNTLINNIHVPNSNMYFMSNNWTLKNLQPYPKISYKFNQIRFEYTATNYVESDKIKFSSQLIPFDSKYSEWSLERVRSFTNLPEGDYTFKVKSIDIYGNIGKEDEFSFTILPPWYRTWWAYSMFSISAILITIGLVKFNTRRLKKQNQILEATVINRTQEIAEQKNKIEEINREVTDSIKYAQMIQNSILPLASDLKKVIPESFIFYKPRDIVSGDFYWIHEIPQEKRILIAAADCTGHGVPGAFMSMMGMEKLNQSVKDIKNINPSLILSYLNKEIKLTLGKHIQERELRDGMELGLIDVNLNNNTILFSGANRPVWIVSPNKNDDEIEIFKPTKAGIAGFTEFDQVFEQLSIKIEKGQSIYLFTDGAIDQFGGPFGKKVMTKGLKNLINSIQNQTMQNQQNTIAAFFKNWQGQHEQVDDILIIGLKLEA